MIEKIDLCVLIAMTDCLRTRKCWFVPRLAMKISRYVSVFVTKGSNTCA